MIYVFAWFYNATSLDFCQTLGCYVRRCGVGAALQPIQHVAVAHVDAVIARLEDDELARHKAAVLVDANDFMKVFLAKRSPRESHQLKVLIVQRIERTGSVAA